MERDVGENHDLEGIGLFQRKNCQEVKRSGMKEYE